MKITRILLSIIVLFSFTFTGCTALNFGGLATTPTNSEKKIPAEFDLKSHVDKNNKVLVLVDGGPFRQTDITMQKKFAGIIATYLNQKARIDKKYIQSDSKALVSIEGNNTGWYSPQEIGQKYGVKYLLQVHIENYNLYQMNDTGYHSGSLVTRALLYDTESGQAVWPENKNGKTTVNKIELDITGKESVDEDMMTSAAHCITRYLYNCAKDQFRSSGEIDDTVLEMMQFE